MNTPSFSKLTGSPILWACILFASFSISCEGFFGKKLDASFIDVPQYDDRQVAYVPIQPVWDNMSFPVDVIGGYDELIYVADGVSDEIISYDQSGNELGRFSVPGLKSISQDRSLDILAIGTFDTLGFTLSTIYRIDLNKLGTYGLNNAFIKNKIVHPFYFKSLPTTNDALVEFGGVGLRANNSYFVTRSGPSVSQLFGADDAVLRFDEQDDYISPTSVTTGGGVLSNYFKSPVGITTLAQPPQSPIIERGWRLCFYFPLFQLYIESTVYHGCRIREWNFL